MATTQVKAVNFIEAKIMFESMENVVINEAEIWTVTADRKIDEPFDIVKVAIDGKVGSFMYKITEEIPNGFYWVVWKVKINGSDVEFESSFSVDNINVDKTLPAEFQYLS